MSRRGHVYKRGDSWTYVLDISLPGQRRRQKTKGGHRTKREALAALNEAQSALQRGLYVEPSKLSVKTFLVDHWLPAIASSLRESTLQGYRSAIRIYVIPRLGETRLQALTPDQLNAFYGDLLREGRLTAGFISRIEDPEDRHFVIDYYRKCVRAELVMGSIQRAAHATSIAMGMSSLETYEQALADEQEHRVMGGHFRPEQTWKYEFG